MNEMTRRVAAAQACIDKFGGQPFEWGRFDCVRLAAFAVKEQGFTVRLSRLRPYKTEAGAVRALRTITDGSLADAVDAQGFARIAPASAWPGDIVAIPGPEPFGCALMVQLSNGRVLGALDGRFAVLDPHDYIAAWRVA